MENQYYDWDDYEFDEDFWFGDEQNEDHPADDDYCCWDPRYTGPSGCCHCKEYHEAEIRSRLWYNRLRRWLWFTKGSLIGWLRRKGVISKPKYIITCEYCEGKFDFNKSGLDCPGCGTTNLPF